MSRQSIRRLQPYLSPAGAWAFGLGTSVGWGSLVITSNTYLSQAGPLGSVLGLLIGAVIMLVISRNYHYLISCFPDSGGAYAFTRDAFGSDQGFLTAWFLILTYLAMLWANATSLPLFAKFFIGNIFRFGRLYSLFGYDVYVGEILLSVLFLVLVVFLCIRSKNLTQKLMIGMAGFLVLGITVCFVGAIVGRDHSMEPAFIPDKAALSQILKIACISPWAFIGFENISHQIEEFSFPRHKSFRILSAAVLSAAALYIFIILLTVTAYPAEYDSWLSYIQDHGRLDGLKGLPVFYAAHHYMGNAGVYILVGCLLALILTSLIGNVVTLSRLIYALARDQVLPASLAELNEQHVPKKAFLWILLISVFVPLLGRTAIGWIVDVTTLGATLTYGFVSAAAMKMARTREDRTERITGMIGLAVMIAFGAYLLVPNLFTRGSMETESYFLFVVWSILGFIFFRLILKKDQTKRFGQTIIVWIALLSMVIFTSLVWMSQSNMKASEQVVSHMQDYHADPVPDIDEDTFVTEELNSLRRTNASSMAVVAGLFAISLGVLFNNYRLMSRRAKESELELGHIRNIANTDPLTGVKSKHAFAELERVTDLKIQEGRADPFAVVQCDVNGLKYINDTKGHKAGDDYIRSASHLICELFQHSPVYRTGGDEFVVYLSGRDFMNRDEILGELNHRAEAHIYSGEVVVSAGMSEFHSGEDHSFHSVFERADKRMYERKQLLKSMGARTRD